MATPSPTTLIPGYQFLASGTTAPSAGIFIPLSSLTGLTSDVANGSTGDGRAVIFRLTQSLLAAYNGLTTVPTHYGITKDVPTGVDTNTIRQTYSFIYDLSLTNVDLVPES